MRRSHVNIGLLVALTAAVLLNALLISRQPERGGEVMPELVHPTAAKTLGASTLLPDEMVQQAPLPGTVARGHLPLPFAPGDSERERAGRQLRNPVPADAETVRSGKKIFGDFCFPCHGEAGTGNGPVVARGFPAPPSLAGESAKQMADGQIFHQLTFGRANMPSYRFLLKPSQRWAVIRYVRELQEKTKQ